MNEDTMNKNNYWMPDGGLTDIEESDTNSTFEDGCEKVAEGVIWDYFSGTYKGISEARFVRFAEYIEHPAYDGIV